MINAGRFKGYANLSSNKTLFCSLTWFSSSRPHSRKRLSGSPSRTYTRDEQNARKKLQGHKERAAIFLYIFWTLRLPFFVEFLIFVSLLQLFNLCVYI
jgi:hypothetical protein